MKGGKVFVQLHSDEPLLECKVLASAIGIDESEAVAQAMVKAGVTSLAEGPRPKAAIAYEERTREIARVYLGQDIKSCLALCEQAVDGLVGAIRGY